MLTFHDNQIPAIVVNPTHTGHGILVLPFHGDACRAGLIKEIKVFVRNKELYRVVARYLALRLYRDGIADGKLPTISPSTICPK